MIPKILSFVDLETTGMSARNGRIIEIGIIRTEEGRMIEEFSTLINPQTIVDPFIFKMTGITREELETAPTFYSIKNKIKELLSDSIFVAHNALFDYSFLKEEFLRIEEDFSLKTCCSVKLSRNLYPRFKHHNLDAIIKRFNLSCINRHRAFDDAKVIWDFYQTSLSKKGEERISKAFASVMKRPSLPIGINQAILDSLPESCGVYIFYSNKNTVLYVGKSINIRDRVLSHFANSKRISIDMKIAQDISRIETIETAGELGALLLEATLVKKMQPLYNRQLRYAYKLLALKKTRNQNYNSCEVVNLQDVPIEEMNQVLAIFKSKKDLKSFLISVSKEYNLCPILLKVENAKGACFNYHLELCFGACINKESFFKYNLRFDKAFYKTKVKDWPFKGPIGIKERSKKGEIFIIDKWCVLGKIEDESQTLDDISRDYLFDSDTYKILNRYLNKNKDFEIYNLQNKF